MDLDPEKGLGAGLAPGNLSREERQKGMEAPGTQRSEAHTSSSSIKQLRKEIDVSHCAFKRFCKDK
jgi:hypothetical protein